jgi:hypothetical protein
MGAVKNAFHDEICAAADDQRADEFDCYEARLHSLLSDLDWFVKYHGPIIYPDASKAAFILRDEIKRMMK